MGKQFKFNSVTHTKVESTKGGKGIIGKMISAEKGVDDRVIDQLKLII